MTDHLPECNVIAGDGLCGICQEDRCICDRLRACEQRATGQAYRNGYARGLNERDAALDAARDAVAAASLRIPYEERRLVYLDDALAAIDALRAWQDGFVKGQKQGERNMHKWCRDAVAALADATPDYHTLTEALAAIDALKGESND